MVVLESGLLLAAFLPSFIRYGCLVFHLCLLFGISLLTIIGHSHSAVFSHEADLAVESREELRGPNILLTADRTSAARMMQKLVPVPIMWA